LIEHLEERFGLPVTTFAVDLQGRVPTGDGPLLLCYDGSDASRHAMERAAQLFADRDAIVVTVWHPTVALGSQAWSGALDSMLHFAEAHRADAELARSVADDGVRIAAAAGLNAEPLAVEATGPVWRTILEIADRHDATIVMGSRGLTGIRAWLGSVSSAVVHHTARPTLIIPPPVKATGRSQA
jgi:nucleotide-binding universal stress UspA family protein